MIIISSSSSSTISSIVSSTINNNIVIISIIIMKAKYGLDLIVTGHRHQQEIWRQDTLQPYRCCIHVM